MRVKGDYEEVNGKDFLLSGLFFFAIRKRPPLKIDTDIVPRGCCVFIYVV